MGTLVNFCAGADLRTLPAKPIGALLFNVPDHGSSSSKISSVQEMRHIAGPNYMMLDSGGYQLLKAEEQGKRMTLDPGLPLKNGRREINLTPRHVMETAAVLQPNFVVGLDFPIRKLKTVAEKEAEFARKGEENVRLAFESAEWWKRLCSTAEFFLPIQCYNLNQLDAFYRRTRGLSYDGISMPIRNLNLAEIALFLVSFYQRGERRVHLLGTFSFGVIALCAFMAHQMFDWISLDATSWRIAAEKGDFFNPLDLSREQLAPSVVVDPKFENLCPCPFCRGISYAQIQSLPRRDKTRLLREHNWWSLDQVCRDLFSNGGTILSLERFLSPRCRRQSLAHDIITILSLVDVLKDENIVILQKILASAIQKRKPTRSSRRQSVSA
jgi:queuine/archaeosine tRNA-ribosyltransferase